MARRIRSKPRRRTKAVTFLPDCPDVIKAIAMQGCTDDEIAFSFGLNPEIIRGWRKIYPSFDKAIEEGRTIADLEVIQALHKKATGFTREYDIAKTVGHGEHAYLEVVTLEEEIQPETNAIKYWLSNRDAERWSEKRHMQITGKTGEPPLGVKSETKLELMSSILSLIQPKPDGV